MMEIFYMGGDIGGRKNGMTDDVARASSHGRATDRRGHPW
jgi:hypothetical protein